MEATIATAFVCPFDGPTPPDRVAALAVALADAGAEVVHLGDTIGSAGPTHLARTLQAVRNALPRLPLGLHVQAHGALRRRVQKALDASVFPFLVGGCLVEYR